MTYCAAIRLKEGMVFASDTRTNAGVDHISTFRKLYQYGVEGERFMVLQTAGSLATSQAVFNKLQSDINLRSELSLNTVSYCLTAHKWWANACVTSWQTRKGSLMIPIAAPLPAHFYWAVKSKDSHPSYT